MIVAHLPPDDCETAAHRGSRTALSMRNELSNKCAPRAPLCPSCAQIMRLVRITSRFEDLPDLYTFNAAPVACRISRQYDRDHLHHAGRNSDHHRRRLARSWALVLMTQWLIAGE